MSPDDRRTIRFRDRFEAKAVPEALREALHDRGLGLPAWDGPERCWWWDDDADGAAAVRYLCEGHHYVLDDEAEARVASLLPDADLRARIKAAETRLRPYQRDGVGFLVNKRRAFLADGMGLGKTVQALLALENLQAHPAIIVCPASVKLSWQAEILKWVPWRSVQVLQKGRDKLQDPDLIVLNPELLPGAIEELLLQHPRAVVLDEAHYFKNPNAQRTQLAEDLMEAVPVRFALSGTPIPNRRPDIIQQLRLLGQLEDVLYIYKGVLPHWWTPAQGPLRHDHAMRAIEALPRKELHQRLKDTCFLRRTKDEVHADLPAFHRTRRDLVLEERSGYRREEESFVEWVRRLRKDFPDGWGATERLQGRQHLGRLRREAALAKIPAVVEWAEGLEGERAIYFAHHKQVVKELAKALPGNTPVITGDVPSIARQSMIDGLGNYDGLVATMDASGQGVDGMQMHARHVVFLELDWTPTKHEQCEGRLHRIGQENPVEAWYFTAQDTIDTAMMHRLDEKWKDLQGILEGDDDESIDAFVGSVMERASKGVGGAGLWRGFG